MGGARRLLDGDNQEEETAIEVRLEDPALLLDLREFLERATCTVVFSGRGRLVVELPSASHTSGAADRLPLIVAGWQALHPNAHLSISRDTASRVLRPRQRAGGNAGTATRRP